MNGSFEIAESGYPVNWTMFPSPENDRNVSFTLDSGVVKDGKYSLRLDAKAIGGTTGIRKGRVIVTSGRRYRISLWAMNKKGAFQVNRILMEPNGKKNVRANIIARASKPSDSWQRFEETILVAENEKYLTLIFRMLKPGTLYLDNVKIEQIPNK